MSTMADNDESSVRRRIKTREDVRPGGVDPSLKTPWASLFGPFAHPGHRWHQAPHEHNLWTDDEHQESRFRKLFRRASASGKTLK
jgi:hypothetical protein